MSTDQKSENKYHLAIIPDGNRRWAKEQGFVNVWKGHEKAIENFRTLTEWCRKNPKISTLTVWCFSTENWKRDPKEVSMLMSMLEEYLKREKKGFIEEKTRFLHSGRRDRIPQTLAALINETETLTKDQQEFTLHLAVDYGGKDEIVRSTKRLFASPNFAAENMREEEIRAHTDQPQLPDIDIILRSSGEKRTSNFFLWQSTYAEWIFNEKKFPDIGTQDLADALEEYEKRKRRFGT